MKTIFTFLLLIPIFINSQSPVYDSLNINNINARIYSGGLLFADTVNGMSSFEFPTGSGQHSIYTSNIWIGGIGMGGQLHLAGQTFAQGKDFYPGPVSNDWLYPQVHSDWNYVWKVTKDEIDDFISWIPCILNPNCTVPISAIPDVILNWPAHGDPGLGQALNIAPFIDYNGDGMYNPMDGDYPCIKGDMAVFTVFNDDYIHTESHGNPLIVEIRAMHYGFNSSDSALNSTIFSEYTVINFSTQTYNEMYVGVFTDADIGCSDDEYAGCDVERNLGYVFNADAIDDDGCNGATAYGLHPPAQGTVILRGPKKGNDGVDNSVGLDWDGSVNGCNYGDWIMDNEYLGMEYFGYFDRNLPANIFGDPNLAIDFYNYMNGFWLDGTHFTYGGDGHGGALNTNYIFPDYSDSTFHYGTNGTPTSQWSETTEGNIKFDRRYFQSMGEFTMAPMDVQEFTIARVSARDYVGDNLASLELLKSYTDDIHNFYACDTTGMYGMCDGQIVAVLENENTFVNVYPNPSTGILNFNSEVQVERLNIYNILGKVVLAIELNSRSQIDISNLPEGVYLIEFEFKKGLKIVRRVIKE